MPLLYTRNSSNARYSCNDARAACAYLLGMGTIHSRIKDNRERLKLSMEQLAERIGVKWQTVQQWENGKTAPTRKRAEKVAKALELSISELLTGLRESGNSPVKQQPSVPKTEIQQLFDNLQALKEKDPLEADHIIAGLRYRLGKAIRPDIDQRIRKTDTEQILKKVAQRK
jgi:transcriptional regulator with XRE-family HTH domain